MVPGGLNLLASLASFGFQWALARLLAPGDSADLFAVLALVAVPSQLMPVGTRINRGPIKNAPGSVLHPMLANEHENIIKADQQNIAV